MELLDIKGFTLLKRSVLVLTCKTIGQILAAINIQLTQWNSFNKKKWDKPISN